MNDVAVVVLAGGRATRFPNKLAQFVDGTPLLARVCSNACGAGWPVYVAGSDRFSPAIAHDLRIPLLTDRWPGGGPLRALFSACETLPYARVFALAGDEPNVGADLLKSLAQAWRPGDDAVIPRHDRRIEPLAALYLREAVVRETPAVLVSGIASMRALIARLRPRFVSVAGTFFANVNTPADVSRIESAAP